MGCLGGILVLMVLRFMLLSLVLIYWYLMLTRVGQHEKIWDTSHSPHLNIRIRQVKRRVYVSFFLHTITCVVFQIMAKSSQRPTLDSTDTLNALAFIDGFGLLTDDKGSPRCELNRLKLERCCRAEEQRWDRQASERYVKQDVNIKKWVERENSVEMFGNISLCRSSVKYKKYILKDVFIFFY